jgi:hypothetical protein
VQAAAGIIEEPPLGYSNTQLELQSRMRVLQRRRCCEERGWDGGNGSTRFGAVLKRRSDCVGTGLALVRWLVSVVHLETAGC